MNLRDVTEAAELLAQRRTTDGLSMIDPFVHQTKFMESMKPETWLFGANRSGKTEGLAWVGASKARFGMLNPKPAYIGGGNWIYDKAVRIWAISLTFDMSRNILQAKMFDNGAALDARHFLIPNDEILNWNITNQTLKLKNGSIIIFKSCDGGRNVFQGADIDLGLFDEVPNEEVYREVTMRVGGGRSLQIRGAATILPPPGVAGGISWMYSAKVRPWLDAGGNTNTENLDIFTASIYDNTTIIPSELRRLESQYPPGSQEYRIRMKGELLPSIGGALVYTPFLRDYHVNKDLILENGMPRIIQHQPLCLTVDWNPENGVWLVAQVVTDPATRRPRFMFLDEICLERSDIGAMAYEFRARFPTHSAELWIWGDTTGRRLHEQTGMSNFHLLQSYLENYPVPLRWHLGEVNPLIVDRVNAVNLVLRPPDGVRQLEISPRCENLIADLEAAKWTKLGKIEKTAGRRQDAADCAGYLIYGVCPTSQHGYAPRKVMSVPSPSYRTTPRSAGPRARIGPRTGRRMQLGA